MKKISLTVLLVSLVAVLSACGGGGGGGGKSAAPISPTSLAVTSTTSSKIDIAWADSSSNESGFKVERSTNDGSFESIGTVGTDVTTYSDSSILSNTKYSYSVSSFNGSGSSSPSNAAETGTFTMDSVKNTLSASVSALKGNEISYSFDVTVPSVATYNISVLGFGLCQPSAPYALPASSPTPPNNIYGCQNNVTVALAPSTDTIALTFTVPSMFIDLSVGSYPAYIAATDVVFTSNAALNTTPDGRKQIGAIQSSSLTHATENLYSNDPFINASGSTILDIAGTQIDDQLKLAISGLAADFIVTLPPYVP